MPDKALLTVAAIAFLLFAVPSAAQQDEAGELVLVQQLVAVSLPEGPTARIALIATARQPGATGEARVRRRRGATEIDVKLDHMRPAILYGGDYNTYVLWTISPEGFVYNCGEFVLNGRKSQLKATTSLSAFSLMVTAEPHFLVERPSPFLVLLTSGAGLEQQKNVTAVKFDFRDFAGEYRHDQTSLANTEESSGLLRADRYQAIVALRFAEEAGAQRWAPTEFEEARSALSVTQMAFAEAVEDRDVALLAHNAVRLAVEAERSARQRAADAALAAERKANEEEIARLRAELAQAEAEATRAVADAQMARETADKLSQQAEAAREAMLRANEEADQLSRAKSQAEQQAQTANEQAAAFFARLYNALDRIAEIEESDRGLVVNLPDILFDSGKSTLRSSARDVLGRIAGVLLVAPEYHLSIEGHTDSTGGEQLNQRLSERRAEAVRDYLLEAQISPALMTARGFGESNPVADNSTSAGRQQNRRVEIVIEGLRR